MMVILIMMMMMTTTTTTTTTTMMMMMMMMIIIIIIIKSCYSAVVYTVKLFTFLSWDFTAFTELMKQSAKRFECEVLLH